jgi:glycosyltransferase involved in cell wall biosynthesis
MTKVLSKVAMTSKCRILCLSRAYPPVIGGIERQNYELFASLAEIAQIKIIANRYGKRNLPFFLPLAFLKTLVYLPGYDVILLGDGMLSFIGWLIKLLSRKKVVCIVHGLDVTLPHRFYQRLWVRYFMPRLDAIVAVSEQTRRESICRGIPPEKVAVVPNGVNLRNFTCEYDRSVLTALIGKAYENRKIILTVGRLIKRKGVAWFVASVMPKLPEEVIYLVVGEGAERTSIEHAIKANQLGDRVFLLGHADEEQKKTLYAVADLYVQPNVKVTGDIEGFGLVVLEAAASCTSVIAARLEGLQDAVTDGKNGVLVEAGNEDEFVRQVNKYLMDDALRNKLGKEARVFVSERFEWHRIAQRYFDIITSTPD